MVLKIYAVDGYVPPNRLRRTSIPFEGDITGQDVISLARVANMLPKIGKFSFWVNRDKSYVIRRDDGMIVASAVIDFQ